jgi:hypothetical protein
MSLLLLFNGGGAAVDPGPPVPSAAIEALAFLSHGDPAVAFGALGAVGDTGALAAVAPGASTACDEQAPTVTITGGGTTTIQ